MPQVTTAATVCQEGCSFPRRSWPLDRGRISCSSRGAHRAASAVSHSAHALLHSEARPGWLWCTPLCRVCWRSWASTLEDRTSLEDHSPRQDVSQFSKTHRFLSFSVMTHMSRHIVVAPFPAAPLLTETRRSAVGSGTREDIVTLAAFSGLMYVAIQHLQRRQHQVALVATVVLAMAAQLCPKLRQRQSVVILSALSFENHRKHPHRPQGSNLLRALLEKPDPWPP